MTEYLSEPMPGVLLRQKFYLIIKNPNGPNTDVGYAAEPGTEITVTAKNSPEDAQHYGGRQIWWANIRGHQCGVEEGVDFEFDTTRPEGAESEQGR